MQLDADACYRALTARDRRFDGRFVTAVVTTGVYCRPVCPARRPSRGNVRFFPCAAAAEEAGFRPCLRCRPESAPGSRAWSGTSVTVARALRLIEEGALEGSGVERLAGRLGVTSRWLRQLFTEQLGASPLAVARTRRIHFARRLLDETDLPVADVAAASGFGSARRLHAAIRSTFRRPPRALRRHGAPGPEQDTIALRLPARPPFDAQPLLQFFGVRALAGVEQVENGRYLRTVRLEGATGVMEVQSFPGVPGVRLVLPAGVPARALLPVAARVGRMFDLDADTGLIAAHLGRDPGLAGALSAGAVRVPGAWDLFELGIRALLGQQISVAAARTLAERLVRMCGTPLAGVARGGLTHLFPTAEQVVRADLSSLGVPRARARAVHAFAGAMAGGTLDLSNASDLEDAVSRLTAIPGVGDWTAHYIALRALGEPDACPASDLGVRQALARGGPLPSPAEVRRRSERWRPWRAYAVMALWMNGPSHRKERS